MKVDSLGQLRSAFAEWRRKKKHVREAIPGELLARARRATEKHGVRAVVGVTGVERARLLRSRPAGSKAPHDRTLGERRWRLVPTFSRLELRAPSAPSPRAIAEVETGSGVRLRMFEQTPELMGLLSAVCGLGGIR